MNIITQKTLTRKWTTIYHLWMREKRITWFNPRLYRKFYRNNPILEYVGGFTVMGIFILFIVGLNIIV